MLAHSFTEQTEALQAQFFPPPTVADLTDIPGTVYPPPICGTDEIIEAEVEAIIQGLKPLKAAGPNGINHLALQTALPHIKKRTTLLFQACLQAGYHPQPFRTANTVVLRKPGKPDYSQAKAYRPIALLDTLGKALEKAVAVRITGIAESFKLLPQH